MTLLWLSFVLLALFVILSLALPILAIWRRGGSGADDEAPLSAARDQLNIGLFRERSGELEREVQQGSVDPEQVIRLQGELQQVLLGDVVATTDDTASMAATGSEPTMAAAEDGHRLPAGTDGRTVPSQADTSGYEPPQAARARLAGKVLLALVLVVPLVSVWLYERLGSRVEVGEALWLAETQQQIDTSRDMGEMLQRLSERLQENPDNIDGWILMGRSLMTLERYDEAAQAYARVAILIEQIGQNPAPAYGYRAQALFFKEQRMTAEVREAVNNALRHDPKESNALSLLGIDAFHRQDYASAVGYWQQVLDASPEGANAEALRAGLARARAMLTAQEAAAVPPAAMPPGAEVSPGVSGPPQVPPAGTGPLAAAPAAASAAGSLPLAATPGASSPAAEGGSSPATEVPSSPAIVEGASLLVTVTLAMEMAKTLSGEEAVFVLARPADGSRMPLAVARVRVADLPLTVRLDDSLAMGPMAKLSSASSVEVIARVSLSGGPIPAPGDLEGKQGPLAVGSGVAVAVEIDRRL